MDESRKKRQANERLMQAIEALNSNDSAIDLENNTNVTGDISMSVMENKENSDLSCIKSEMTEDKPNDFSSNHDSKDLEASNFNINKRKVNVFEYNNLVNNNKKMRFINLNRPLQRTDIIHLENSLDFDKEQSSKNIKSKVMMSQRFPIKDVLSK